MSCCCPHSVSGSKIFSFFAKYYQKRFYSKGFEPNQLQLLDGLRQVGYAQSSLLEVGCGVGCFHQTMLESGAKTALGIDLSDEMIALAKSNAIEKGLKGKTQYISGDLIELQQSLEIYDVCILDKVVCCYPDDQALLDACFAHTGHTLALTYPLNRWHIRLLFGFGALLFKVVGSQFRPYVHSPQRIEDQILSAGFRKSFEDRTFIWLTQIFTKKT